MYFFCLLPQIDSDYVSSESTTTTTELPKIIHRFDVISEEMILDKNSTGNTTNMFEKNKLGEDNVGFQIMQTIGWKGGALGKKGTGIIEPIG